MMNIRILWLKDLGNGPTDSTTTKMDGHGLKERDVCGHLHFRCLSDNLACLALTMCPALENLRSDVALLMGMQW